MSRVRDRTEDFKESVRVAALGHGYTESQLAVLMSSFIIRKPAPKLPFTKAAIKTLESIRELEKFIVKHRKDYVDLHRTTEQERDNIEHEVSVFVKACKEQIDILKNRIHEEKGGSTKTWLGTSDESSRLDLIAHQHGVVLILSERLHSVTAQFDRLRTMRFQDAINRAMPRKRIQKKRETKAAEPSKPNLVLKSDVSKVEDQEVSTAPLRVQEQLLDDETRALQVELTNLLDAVQETETKMIEMSALNHLMSTHVLQQAQQIQYLYDQAVEATNNVERGNKELSQAIQRNSSSRTFLLLFFFVLTFSVLFLDWYSK
ncbi:syntaxin-81-like [Oryza glaberrima]|uniref:SNARE-complex protein Syntaxin-18 N-terminal domain-containing protein n=1 Tax=Oryza glaberrima TaxID=4538 RepID=I1PNA0_ORYGL|nr:syntaxin-81-like [Oryza glaberrima]